MKQYKFCSMAAAILSVLTCTSHETVYVRWPPLYFVYGLVATFDASAIQGFLYQFDSKSASCDRFCKRSLLFIKIEVAWIRRLIIWNVTRWRQMAPGDINLVSYYDYLAMTTQYVCLSVRCLLTVDLSRNFWRVLLYVPLYGTFVSRIVVLNNCIV